jgi:predicted metal-dependent hydrolase
VSEQVRRKLKAAMQENARLQAEVDRLTNTSTNADRFLISKLEQDVAILKEQVARLTKAEDKMIEITYMKGIAGINRGVQS